MVLAYRGKTEIAWEVASSRVIDRVCRETGLLGSFRHGVSYFYKDRYSLNLQYDEADFHAQLAEKFHICKVVPDAAELSFFHRPFEGGPALGYITEDHKRALVVGEGFGLFKSAVSALASLQIEPEGYVPAHAAALSLGGKGVLLVGGSRGGKTTALFNVAINALSQGMDVRILCDDWLVVTTIDGRLAASTFDPSISLTLTDLERAISLEGIDSLHLLDGLRSRDKISVPPARVFGESCQAQEILIDSIVVINPRNGLDRCDVCGAEGLADFIISSAYHFPYVLDQVRSRHHKFWSAWASRLEVYEYSYLGGSDFRSSISRLVEMLSTAA
ncbi:MAG: hypothetical protein ACJ8ER_15775 [Allosphingosinicella sp.]